MPLKSKKSKPKRRREEDEDEDEDIVDDDGEEEEDEDEDIDEDDEDEEEEEEDEPPKRKSKSKTAAKKTKKKSRSDDEDDDDDSEQDDEDDEDDEPVKGSKKSFYSESTESFNSPAGGQDERIKFEADEEQRIIFATDRAFIFYRHYLGQGRGAGYKTCPGKGCPLCEAGNKASQAGAFHVFVVTGKEGREKFSLGTIIEGNRFGKKFATQLKKKTTLNGIIYGITKTGKDTTTDWDFEYQDKVKLPKAQQRLAQSPPIDFRKKFAPPDAKTLKKLAATIASEDADDYD